MPIAHHVAANPRDACAQIARNRHATLLAGGTLVMGAVNTGDTAIAALVDIEKLGLRKITFSAAKVTLGAMTTMADIANHPKLGFLAPVARAIGGPAVREMATVGGNLFAPAPYGDLGAALLALDAEVSLVAAQRQKTVPLETFFRDRGKLGPVLVTSVSFKPPGKATFCFVKATRRKPVSAAVVSIAVVLPQKASKLSAVRIAYGAMAATPMRAKAAEAALEGKALDRAAIARAAGVAGEGCAPETDEYASAWYRREILPVYLARLLSGRPA